MQLLARGKSPEGFTLAVKVRWNSAISAIRNFFASIQK
jgi:hypothetical protein